jgi:uncharacterized membrane protein YfcA
VSVTFAVTMVLAVGVGVSLGLLGGGGSILAVPLLVYVAGLPVKDAIATSLLVVGTTSAVGLMGHARAGRVSWRTGLVFGAAGMAGAYAGGRLAALLPSAVLLAGFAAMMLATAAAMIRGRGTTAGRPIPDHLPARRAIVYGMAVGLVAGLVGAGGGFLIVPALVLLGGLAMPSAVGTSMLVIALQSLAGFAGHLPTTTVHWGLASGVTVAAVGGALLGVRMAGRANPDQLRRWFGWVMLGVAVLILIQQWPLSLLWMPVVFTAVIGVTAIARGRWRRLRPIVQQPQPLGSPIRRKE